MLPDDPFWVSPEGADLAGALCARYGVTSLPQVLYVVGERDTGTHPALAIVLELCEAVRAEERTAAELASTVACPYCAAPAGRLCVRKRGRFVGQPLGGFAERVTSPFRSASFHRRRLTAAIEAGLAAMRD